MANVPVGVAVRLPGVEGGVESTATEVVAVLVPFVLLELRVYTVVDVGFTIKEPDWDEVEKVPGVMMVVEAFDTLKESVDEPPESTSEGDAEKEEIEGGLPDALNAMIPAVTLEEVTLKVQVAAMEPADDCVESPSAIGNTVLKSFTEKGLATVICAPPFPFSSTAQLNT
jgi:hypothetical protein